MGVLVHQPVPRRGVNDMKEYVLLVFMMASPADSSDPIVVPVEDAIECSVLQSSIPTQIDSIDIETACVTMDHWLGNEIMPDVAMD